jgi:hypothetical protein
MLTRSETRMAVAMLAVAEASPSSAGSRVTAPASSRAPSCTTRRPAAGGLRAAFEGPAGSHRDAGGGKVKYCGEYSCDEPIADAELYTP